MSEKTKNMLSLALGIALLPPIWAVLSPYLGVMTGSVALITAGLYVAHGNRREDALKISAGFLLGDLWAILAIGIMEKLPLNPNVELYCTLFMLGFLAVILGESFSNLIFTPSWLCGWAIGLTIMGPMQLSELHGIPVQIGIAMLVGVFYVGIGVDIFQGWLLSFGKKK